MTNISRDGSGGVPMRGHAAAVGRFAAMGLAFSLLAACGGGGAGGGGAKVPGGGPVDSQGNAINKAAQDAYRDGLAKMAQHDKANDWTDADCAATAALFDKANEQQDGGLLRAQYNAGVAHSRCKQVDKAKAYFGGILAKDAKFHRARVQVALYDYAKSKDIEKAIAEMKQAITDAEFKNEEALVNLAIFQMSRDSSQGESGCEDDFACAKLNLQRALAINDSFMPAFNQLAVYYLQSAKKQAGKKTGSKTSGSAKRSNVNKQALELAELVCSQALRKNPNYAPVHNTSGLISSELGNLSAAARSFGLARKLDPKFFEAHMNYAAVNLKFRGFKQAQAAYQDAIKLQPNDYEAYLGLALAVRGLITPQNEGAMVAESEKHLQKAKSIAPDRPETYYNEAILTQEFKAREGGTAAEPMLNKAKGLFQQFIAKAEGKDGFEESIDTAKERMEEIDQTIAFNKQTAEMQKQMEQMRKQEEARKQLEEKKEK
ncbi:MAG: hypothetical protein AAGA56_00395 [Myxococcota bacterium]